ncbi:MAG: FtsX-like permease family protein, partial [Actinomycetia bacterium]|nr:FtsX-like permease family protein [Actinomycetes bacterium]
QLADGVSESAGSAAISAELGDVGFESGAEAAQERVSDMTGETNVLGAILFGFAGVSLVTAAIVIANTFTITLAQRTEELALLRAVGATKRQVRRMVLLEAVVLGLLASIAGVLIGIALAAGLVALANRSQLDLPLGSGITVTRLAVLVPIAVGLVVTLLGALLPAARATRVSPLAAMRPDGHSEAAHRLPWVRLLVGLALLGVGCLAMVYAASSRDVFVGLLGGVVSFAGVLLALVAIVPALVRALGLLVRLVGVPGRIAVDNAVRNPGRAAATSAALLVGVTLITMTTIGAASAERTAVGEIDDKFAVDFVLANLAQSGDGLSVIGEDLEPDVPARVAEIAGVEASALVSTAYLRLGEQDWPTMAVGLEAADLEVLRSGEQAATLVPGTLGLSGQMQAIHGLPAGSTVLVSGPGGSRELSVVGLGVSDLLGLHAQDLQALAGETVRHGAVIVRAGEDANLGSVLRGLQDLASDGTFVQGQAVERAMITQILTVMVLIASALLGVAVLIALVGIANTLSLSVIERAREHALLRGLGLTRTQLRLTLLVEGVLFAVVASLIGIGLGVLYAWLGVQTVLPGHTDVRLALPMDRLLLIAGVAVVAGALASLLPARRAAKVSPVSGLVAT